MDKVLLVNPGRDPRFAVQEPLHLAFLAGFLRAHSVPVRIVDELAGEDVMQAVEEWRPDIVGITATTPLVKRAYALADQCRQRSIRTVMGGVHASVMTDEALAHADVVVKGEGERALLDIVTQGVSRGVVTAPVIEDLDVLPRPARDLLRMDFYAHTLERHPESYLHFVPPGSRVAAMLTSRGCPFNCIFCHNTWRDTPFRFHSARRVVDELGELCSEYAVQAVFFIEDNFFAGKQRLRQICRLMTDHDIRVTWGCNARVSDIDRELLATVKEAGCRQITFGFESGSQRVLDTLRKGTSVEQNWEAVRICNETGIAPQGTVMVGSPGETVEDIRKTQQFILNARIDSVGVCLATAYPGTELWRRIERSKGIPNSLDWEQFTYDRVPFDVCDTIAPDKLMKLYQQTKQIAADKRDKRPFTIRATIRDSLRHPLRTARVAAMTLKTPGRINSIRRRLSLR